MRGGDRASTDVPIAPRDASDGRLSGLVLTVFIGIICALVLIIAGFFIQQRYQRRRDEIIEEVNDAFFKANINAQGGGNHMKSTHKSLSHEL